MALRLPPLPALRLFEAAARHQSFKRAADELNLTPSAVSHGVVSLEQWLGVDLFERGSTRGVTLTAAGRQYLPYVAEALSMIATGTQRLPGRRTDRRVVLSVAPTFASRWLIPNLHSFRKLHPGIGVSLDTSHRQALFPMDGVDLAIRMGRGPWPGTESVLLLRERLLPVASPDYLRAIARDGRPDWGKATFLRVTSIENDWEAWIEGAGETFTVGAGLQFDTIQMALDAAAEGLGVAVGRLPLLQRDLGSGRVVPAAETEVPIETGYWLVGEPGEETRTEIRAFKRWIIGELEGTDGQVEPEPQPADAGTGE